MSGNRRIWTVGEANARIPGLAMLVGRQLGRAAEIERRWKRFVDEVGPERADLSKILRRGGEPEDELPEPMPAEIEIRDLVHEYEAGWRAIEADGVMVKDPRIGLCDFYGRIDGKLVWLCWRYGEEAVNFYHDLDAGFSGRKPLTAATRQRLLN